MTEQEVNQVVERVAKREKLWQIILSIVGLCFTIAVTVLSFVMGGVNKNIDSQTKEVKALKEALIITNQKIAIMTYQYGVFEEDLSEALEDLEGNVEEHTSIKLRLQRLER